MVEMAYKPRFLKTRPDVMMEMERRLHNWRIKQKYQKQKPKLSVIQGQKDNPKRQ